MTTTEMTTTTTITNRSSNEEFINGAYNGMEVLIRKRDGYINATKMCLKISEKRKLDNKSDKRFRDFMKSGRWLEIKSYFDQMSEKRSLARNRANAIDELYNGYSNELRGHYVHPKLVHFVAEWADLKYAFDVAEIMDSINERLRVTGESFETVKDEIIESQEHIISEQKEIIGDQLTIISDQDETIHETSTRTPENCMKRLTIYNDNGVMKLSCNNDRYFKTFVKQWFFPASLNMRQTVNQLFKLDRMKIPEEKLNAVIDYIDSCNPK